MASARFSRPGGTLPLFPATRFSKPVVPPLPPASGSGVVVAPPVSVAVPGSVGAGAPVGSVAGTGSDGFGFFTLPLPLPFALPFPLAWGVVMTGAGTGGAVTAGASTEGAETAGADVESAGVPLDVSGAAPAAGPVEPGATFSVWPVTGTVGTAFKTGAGTLSGSCLSAPLPP